MKGKTMKKSMLFLLGLCFLTAGCAASGVDGSTTTMGRMKTCLTNEAMTSLTNGTLYTNGVSATAKTISGYCIKSLAMENLGIDTQTTQMATTILSAMQAAKK